MSWLGNFVIYRGFAWELLTFSGISTRAACRNSEDWGRLKKKNPFPLPESSHKHTTAGQSDCAGKFLVCLAGKKKQIMFSQQHWKTPGNALITFIFINWGIIIHFTTNWSLGGPECLALAECSLYQIFELGTEFRVNVNFKINNEQTKDNWTHMHMHAPGLKNIIGLGKRSNFTTQYSTQNNKLVLLLVLQSDLPAKILSHSFPFRIITEKIVQVFCSRGFSSLFSLHSVTYDSRWFVEIWHTFTLQPSVAETNQNEPLGPITVNNINLSELETSPCI